MVRGAYVAACMALRHVVAGGSRAAGIEQMQQVGAGGLRRPRAIKARCRGCIIMDAHLGVGNVCVIKARRRTLMDGVSEVRTWPLSGAHVAHG